MKSLEELDHLTLDPAAKKQVAAMLQALHNQVQRDAILLQTKDAAIQAKDFKIEALTHEIAYYRRIRYGVKSEAFSAVQRDVFEPRYHFLFCPYHDFPDDPKRTRLYRFVKAVYWNSCCLFW